MGWCTKSEDKPKSDKEKTSHSFIPNPTLKTASSASKIATNDLTKYIK
jgi:hypothetical protein